MSFRVPLLYFFKWRGKQIQRKRLFVSRLPTNISTDKNTLQGNYFTYWKQDEILSRTKKPRGDAIDG